eukprot:Gb_16894 [translate_table: standard]
MGLADSMGEYHKRSTSMLSISSPSKSPWDRRTGTRRVSQRGDSPDGDFFCMRKRSRILIGPPQKHSHSIVDIFLPRLEPPINSSANFGVRSRSGSKLDLFPPPSPLPRSLQGPQRTSRLLQSMGSTPKRFGGRVWEQERFVSDEDERSVVELEGEWRTQSRHYETDKVNLEETANLKGLEQYKRRVAALQERFGNAFRRPNANANSDEKYTANSRILSENGKQQDHDSSTATLSSSSAIVVHDGLNAHLGKGPAEKDIATGSGNDRAVKPAEDRPLYVNLHEKANERDFTLKALKLELELTTAKLEALQFTKKELFQKKESEVGKEKLVALHDVFAPLKDDEEADVSHALHGRNRREVLVMHKNSNIEITREVLQCLLPGAWLNDEVINLYLELLKERETREPKKFLKCHFFNTFFYKKLFNPKTKYDYKAVRRWTTQRKLGYSLMDCDKIFVPIHKEIHWCLAIIDTRAKKFQYLDSLKGGDANVLKVLARYITDETKDKIGKDLDVSTWEQEFVEDLPEQENGWDCGMFMVKYADFHSRGLPLNFCQANMPYFRKRTAKEILRLRAE